jgi:hypothetical protein
MPPTSAHVRPLRKCERRETCDRKAAPSSLEALGFPLMRRINPWLLGVLAGAWLCFGSGSARADTKFEMGARLGYGVPFGKGASDGSKLNTAIVGQVPVWLDAGARIADHYFVGMYFDYGFGVSSSETKAACKLDQAAVAGQGVDVSCSSHDARVGVEFLYHLLPTQRFDPWLGVGFGYEWFGLSETASVGTSSATVTFGTHGFELVNLQLGLDISISESVVVGPFMAFTLAQYRKSTLGCSGDCSGAIVDSSADINNKTVHEWLLFGARFTYQL